MSAPVIPLQLVPSDEQSFVIVPANPDMLAITRLYLEKYELLEPEDRELFRDVIAVFNNRPNAFFEGARVK